MDDDKRKQTHDSEHVRQDSDDRRNKIREDRKGTTEVTDWNKPPRPDKDKEQDRG